MAKKITVRMSPQLRRNLTHPYLIAAPLKEYLFRATTLIRDEGRAEAPEDLGKMRRSHVALVDPQPVPRWGRMEVKATSKGAPYPLFVHEGTRPHFPPIDAIAPWANRHGIPPFALAMSIAQKGTKANPWLERTIEKLRPHLQNLNGLAADIIKKWNKP